MTRVRPAAVAGSFYPGDPAELAATLDGLLADVVASDDPAIRPPVALLVPHAGYVYSGPVAATAYAPLRRWAGEIRRVVVAGPAHRVRLDGMAVPTSDGFATPLGVVPVDLAACDRLLAHPGVVVDDRAHRDEHSIEVHLPFLQRVLGEGWQLVPVVAGGGSARMVADALAPLWGAEGTLVVISTDLSHYHDLPTARVLDRETAGRIVALEWERLGAERACGLVPVRGALELARRRGEHVTLVDLRTSGDTAGPTDRVVGYGSFVIR